VSDQRIDSLARVVATGTSRRRLTGGLAGTAIAGLLTILGAEQAGAGAGCFKRGRRCRRNRQCCKPNRCVHGYCR
jgi:hypothetical protein